MPSSPTPLPRPRVAVVVPLLSEFRRPFFQKLTEDLDAGGIDLVIAHGAPYDTDLRAREDAVPVEEAVRLPQRTLRIAGRSLVHKRLGATALVRTADVVVVEQALHNLELYPLLLRPRASGGPAVAMWGHGHTYTKRHSPLEQSLKAALTRRARWFFAYTEGGARSVQARGFPRDRVTVVQNAIDTTALRDTRQQLSRRQLADMRREYGLTEGKTALFVGALSTGKRLDFLLEAAQRAAALLPGFRLLVAGTGEQRDLVEAAAARTPQILPVGQAFGARKALLGALSDVLLMPGRVGLCAVDSFALETPIVTTPWPYHAPEFEYLQDGHNAVIAPDDAEAYARAVVDLLSTPEHLARLREGCRADARQYTVEEMSRRFSQGLAHLITEIR